jgi:hypothetical protein
MFHDTQRTSRRTDRRGHTVGVVLAVTMLTLLAATVAAPVAAGNNEPTVRVVGETVETDGTARVHVVLTAAPDGLSGYSLELSLGNPDVAHVEGAGYPESFGLTTEAEVGADGRTVTLEAADLEGNVEPGASNVTLARVEIASEAAGETAVAVDDVRLDDDSGDPLDPTVRSGTVAVTDGSQEATSPGDSEADQTPGDSEADQTPGDSEADQTRESTANASDSEADEDGESSGTGAADDETSGASGDLPLYVPVVAIGMVALAAALLGYRP